VRMRQGIYVATGVEPSDRALALALAKTALETARWKSMWNWNWGNIKAGENFEGMYTCISLNEVLEGKTVWFAPSGRLDVKGGRVIAEAYKVPPGHPQTRMRAYANGFDGAQEYVTFLANGRYRDAWARLLEGDPVGFVRELKAKGYFTADESSYRLGVVRVIHRVHHHTTHGPLSFLLVDRQADTLCLLPAGFNSLRLAMVPDTPGTGTGPSF